MIKACPYLVFISLFLSVGCAGPKKLGDILFESGAYDPAGLKSSTVGVVVLDRHFVEGFKRTREKNFATTLDFCAFLGVELEKAFSNVGVEAKYLDSLGDGDWDWLFAGADEESVADGERYASLLRNAGVDRLVVVERWYLGDAHVHQHTPSAPGFPGGVGGSTRVFAVVRLRAALFDEQGELLQRSRSHGEKEVAFFQYTAAMKAATRQTASNAAQLLVGDMPMVHIGDFGAGAF